MNYNFYFLSLLSFIIFSNAVEKPTLESLVNANKVSISFDCYRDEQQFNKESWQNIVVATSDLVDKCDASPLNDALFQEVYSTIESIRSERKANLSSGIHGALSVSVGEPTEKIAANESQPNLVWLGCLTTGYDPNKDIIQEIAVVITDAQLNILAQSPAFEVDQASLDLIEADILDFIKPYATIKPYLGGHDRIMKERTLLKKYMPNLEAIFSTVTMNSFSMRQLCKLWHLDIYYRNDIRCSLQAAHEAIAEMRFYKENYFLHI